MYAFVDGNEEEDDDNDDGSAVAGRAGRAAEQLSEWVYRVAGVRK